MNWFNSLEIQTKIEEKRLILGQKLEAILLANLRCILKAFTGVLHAKSTAFFVCLSVITISIFVRSMRDIGHDSAFYLDVVGQILQGDKYYYDFLKIGSLLHLFLTIIPVFLSKLFSFSPIIAIESFVNILGIISLYLSARILNRSHLSKNRVAFNLLIISFSVGYFLRIFNLQYNELAVQSTYFLVLAFPYISYQFLQKSQLNKGDHIVSGVLAALFFAMQPFYGILAVIFEAQKAVTVKSLRVVFCLRNYITLSLLISYQLLMLKLFPEHLYKAVNPLEIYHNKSIFEIFLIIKDCLLPLFFLIFICRSLIRESDLLKVPFLAVLAGILMVIVTLEQKSLVFTLFLPLILLITLELAKNHKINGKASWMLLAAILLIPQFDHNFFTNIVFQMGIFWWIFVLILSIKYRRTSQEFNILFLPRGPFSWLCFILSAFYTTWAIIYNQYEIFVWVLSSIMLILLIDFYQDFHERLYNCKKFSLLTAAAIFIVFSYVLNLQIESIIFDSKDNKSPNYISDSIANISQGEEFIIISPRVNDHYPLSNYLKNEVFLASTLYSKMKKNGAVTEAQHNLLSQLRVRMRDQKTKLIFIDNSQKNQIGFLEYYFRDPEFRKEFVKNYNYITRIKKLEKYEGRVEFYANESSQEAGTQELISRDIEVYKRVLSPS